MFNKELQMPFSAQKTAPAVTFRSGDIVLYRDPEMFWAGKPAHTFVCKVTYAWMSGTCDLRALASGRVISHAQPDYMRLLPPLDAMRDIDTASLHVDGAADAMTAAAMAWLAQQHATANAAPQLPAPRD
ncbi:hypothetical protein ACPCSP_30620 [Streptomyces cinereoruber]|uniref:hypothetical protein n=1 Tax=Streptomyces cinereoruber TaxID=67260 RepID=UPI003C2D3756